MNFTTKTLAAGILGMQAHAASDAFASHRMALEAILGGETQHETRHYASERHERSAHDSEDREYEHHLDHHREREHQEERHF
jgi:hypothetical protein